MKNDVNDVKSTVNVDDVGALMLFIPIPIHAGVKMTPPPCNKN
jgi:hypothetical protein